LAVTSSYNLLDCFISLPSFDGLSQTYNDATRDLDATSLFLRKSRCNGQGTVVKKEPKLELKEDSSLDGWDPHAHFPSQPIELGSLP